MKVLQIIDGDVFGGIAKIMSDIGNNITDIKFDYLTTLNVCDDWINLGISRKTLKGKIIYNHRLHKFLKENKYDIVHINSAVFLFSFQVVLICKLSKIKNVVVHSHNSLKLSFIRKLLMKILNPLYRKLTKAHLTCSPMASKSLYTKDDDVILIKNGIDIEKFKYNEKLRVKYRKDLNIENKLVYGHVGRFFKEKNHEFLIDVFYELQKKQDALLLLVGDGTLESDIKEKVKDLNIADKVLFLGFRDDISNILNAMDIFIFPSLHEGLPISLIEAQTNGLSVVTSSCIPNEANISNDFIKMNDYDTNNWVNTILNIKLSNRENSYKNAIKNGYDIKDVSNELKKIYNNLIK